MIVVWLIITWLWLVATIGCTSYSLPSSLTAPGFSAHNYKYEWEADLDVSTGLASSNEISVYEASVSSTDTLPYDPQLVSSVLYPCIQSCFETYPTWGILRLLTSTTSHRATWFPLIRFGNPVTTLHHPVHGIVVEIPILAGLLVGPPTNSTYARIVFSFRSHDTWSLNSRHALAYRWTVQSQMIHYSPTLFHVPTQAVRPCKIFHHTSIHRFFRFLVSLYQSFWKMVYLKTQSLVHAWVLWRFHKYCMSRMIQSIQSLYTCI
jgi:hypothetical protein